MNQLETIKVVEAPDASLHAFQQSLSTLLTEYILRAVSKETALSFLSTAQERAWPSSREQVVAYMSFLATAVSLPGVSGDSDVLSEMWTQFSSLAINYCSLEGSSAKRTHVIVDLLVFSRVILALPLAELKAGESFGCAEAPTKRAKPDSESVSRCRSGVLIGMFSHCGESTLLHGLAKLWTLYLRNMSWDRHVATFFMESPDFIDTLAIMLSYCIRPHPLLAISKASVIMSTLSYIIINGTHTDALPHMSDIGLISLIAKIPSMPLPLEVTRQAILCLRFIEPTFHLVQPSLGPLQALVSTKLADLSGFPTDSTLYTLDTFAYALCVARTSSFLSFAQFDEDLYFPTLLNPDVSPVVKDAVFVAAVKHASLHPGWNQTGADVPRFVQFAALYEGLDVATRCYPDPNALGSVVKLLCKLSALLMEEHSVGQESLILAISQTLPLGQILGIVQFVTPPIMAVPAHRKLFLIACRILGYVCKSPATSKTLHSAGLSAVLKDAALNNVFPEVKRACFVVLQTMASHERVAKAMLAANIPVAGLLTLVSSSKHTAYVLEPVLRFLMATMTAYTMSTLTRDIGVANASGPSTVNSVIGRLLTSPLMSLRGSAEFLVSRSAEFDGSYEHFTRDHIQQMVCPILTAFTPPAPLSCAVCLCDDQDPFVVLPCMHMYHHACIMAWFLAKKTAVCPTCKRCVVAAHNEHVANPY